MADASAQIEGAFLDAVAQLVGGVPGLEDVLEGLEPQELRRCGREAARHALAPLIWRAAAGESLTTEQVRELWPISRQALHKRAQAGTLLGLPAGRTTLYPRWQFDARGALRPSVGEIVRVFRERLGDEFDPRIVASWATTRQPELRGETPADWLAGDLDPHPVVQAAVRAAESLAR
jgi:hypothetical protein